MSNDLRIVIIEDEAATARHLAFILNAIHPAILIQATLTNIAEACSWFSENQRSDYDLIFSDIRLSDGLSFEIFRQVPVDRPVIFITAYDNYPLDAFRNNGIDYILKPFDAVEIGRALTRYQTLITNNLPPDPARYERLQQQLHQNGSGFKRSFLIHHRDRLIPVDARQIHWFYTAYDVVYAHTSNGTQYVIPFTLEQLEDQLDPAFFFRANRQYIVNRHSVKTVEYFLNGRLLLKLLPAAPDRVLVSKARAMAFRKWMDQ